MTTKGGVAPGPAKAVGSRARCEACLHFRKGHIDFRDNFGELCASSSRLWRLMAMAAGSAPSRLPRPGPGRPTCRCARAFSSMYSGIPGEEEERGGARERERGRARGSEGARGSEREWERGERRRRREERDGPPLPAAAPRARARAERGRQPSRYSSPRPDVTPPRGDDMAAGNL